MMAGAKITAPILAYGVTSRSKSCTTNIGSEIENASGSPVTEFLTSALDWSTFGFLIRNKCLV